jgi:paraquat-inducible protein B
MSKEASHSYANLPRAKTKSRPLRFSLIWVVPIVAALVAGYLIYHRVREFGHSVTVRFRDVEGLKPGQSSVQFRGAAIGEVVKIELSPDQQYAIVKIKLRRFASSVAREGSIFWIVRPQLGMGNLTGLGTIIAGPHIAVLPGNGKITAAFVGLENSPMVLDPNGLKVILLSSRGGSFRAGVPIYYRGIEVGAVQDTELSTNSIAVEIRCVIRHRYAELVRSGSKFWNVTGLDVRVGLFRGAEVNVESLKSLFIGGIAFATPDDPKSNPVQDGMIFRLYDQPDKEWLDWSPRITIPSDDTDLPEIKASRNPPPSPRNQL